jgi:uncharacterized protein (TIGR02147 family)
VPTQPQSATHQIKPQQKVSVYHFLDPVLFLNESLTSKKKRNPKFSIRAWAKTLKISQPTVLSQILANKRPIPSHFVAPVSTTLKLSKEEALYFEAIVGLKNSKNSAERTLWTRQAQKLLSAATFDVQWMDDFEYFKDPTLHVLLNLVSLPTFSSDPKWVNRQLRSPLDERKIRDGYSLLIRRGLLRTDETGQYIRTSRNLSSRHDTASLAVKHFHEKALAMATDAIYSQSIEEREFGSYLLAIDQADLAQMKQDLRNFTVELIGKYTQTPRPNSIYHLNLNLFLQAKASND